jgi:lipoate-protein ligase A
VATDYVEREGTTVVRRVTGGGAVYCEPGGVLTYSLAAPRAALPDDVAESFRVGNEWVVAVLRDLGVDARHDPLNDIAHPDGKVAGAAQLRTEDAVLHHAVLSHTLDAAEMVRVLRIGADKLSDKAVRSAERAVAPVGRYVDLTPGEVTDALREGFRDRFGGTDGALTDAEVAGGERRARERFGTDEWTRRL